MFKERFKDAKREIKKPLKKIQHNDQKKTNHTKNMIYKCMLEIQLATVLKQI